jgi:hypothetical protein
MLRLLVMLFALGADPWLRALFARTDHSPAAPDLFLVALCFVVLTSERRTALACALVLALWRAPLGLASPSTTIAAYWFLTQMRRVFVAAGPLTRLLLSAWIYGAWLFLRATLPGQIAEPDIWTASSLMRWFLTAGMVPLLLGARGGWLPKARALRTAHVPRVVLR